jgi:hypothetical protein
MANDVKHWIIDFYDSKIAYFADKVKKERQEVLIKTLG